MGEVNGLISHPFNVVSFPRVTDISDPGNLGDDEASGAPGHPMLPAETLPGTFVDPLQSPLGGSMAIMLDRPTDDGLNSPHKASDIGLALQRSRAESGYPLSQGLGMTTVAERSPVMEEKLPSRPSGKGLATLLEFTPMHKASP